jgi:hypothetical protein
MYIYIYFFGFPIVVSMVACFRMNTSVTVQLIKLKKTDNIRSFDNLILAVFVLI